MRKKTVMRLAAIVATFASMMFGLVPAALAGYTEPSFHNDAFRVTWERDDLGVLNGANKSWTWGPAYASAAGITTEPYKEAPNGTRTVQYFDKSRMEDNSWRASGQWGVTNGLLVVEMVSGMMQLGDDTFFDCGPAEIPVAGDRVPSNLLTYARFHDVLNPGGEQWFADYFGEFMAQDNATYKVGLASSPAWWTDAPVGGQMRHILVQLGERRALTYTEGNPDGWKVEWGNVGQHYYEWRYGPGGCEDKLRAQNGGGDNGDVDTGNNGDQSPVDTIDTGSLPAMPGDQSHGAWQIHTNGEIQNTDPTVAEWLGRILDPAPAVWRTFPNIPNPDVKDFDVANGVEYGTYDTPYCYTAPCDFPVGAWEYRYYTGSYSFKGIKCKGDETTGCMLVVVNVMDKSVTFRKQVFDNGFTLRGRYWNGDKLDAGMWGLISHGSANMLNMPTLAHPDEVLNSGSPGNSGANCGDAKGCGKVDVTLIVVAGDRFLAVAHTVVTKPN